LNVQGKLLLTSLMRFSILRLPRLALLLLLGTILLLPWTIPLGAQGRPGVPADLQALITEALQANPEIKEKSQLKTASKESIHPAGSLDDPKFSFNILALPVNTWAFNEWDMTQKQLAISQKFPFPGKLRLRSEVAEEQSRSDEFSHQDKINEIRTRVIQGYWTLSLAYASYDITLKNKHWWEQVVQVAETRYAVGRGLQADVLQAQVELGGYLDRLFKWRQSQESVQADLNALRSQPPGTPIPRPQALQARTFTLKLANLLKMAADQPRLQALQAKVAKQGKAVDLARKDFFPDFTVGLAYGLRESVPTRERPDFFSSSFTVNVPIWQRNKLKPRVREQQARKAAAQDAYRAAVDRLNAAIKDRFEILQRLAEQIKLYGQGIIPQARQAAESSLAAYQAGALDFATLSQNFIALYNAELKWQEYLKNFEGTWAEMEWLVGQELPRIGAAG
jgi:cobalt-zinc-cadmium efflux system outer membrane protein